MQFLAGARGVASFRSSWNHKSTYSYCIQYRALRISQYLLGDVYHQDLIQRCSLRLPKACWPRHPLHGYLIILV